MTGLDIYADNMEPAKEQTGTVYEIRVPGHARTHWARLLVDNSGYCELENWQWGELRHRPGGWGNSPKDQENYKGTREVWEWLAEWELVELKPIGPEDSEYFATDKLAKS